MVWEIMNVTHVRCVKMFIQFESPRTSSGAIFFWITSSHFLIGFAIDTVLFFAYHRWRSPEQQRVRVCDEEKDDERSWKIQGHWICEVHRRSVEMWLVPNAIGWVDQQVNVTRQHLTGQCICCTLCTANICRPRDEVCFPKRRFRYHRHGDKMVFVWDVPLHVQVLREKKPIWKNLDALRHAQCCLTHLGERSMQLRAQSVFGGHAKRRNDRHQVRCASRIVFGNVSQPTPRTFEWTFFFVSATDSSS